MIFFVIVLYDSREVEFDSPAKLDLSYFFTKKNVCLTEETDEVLWGQRQTTVMCDKISKHIISTITPICVAP